MPQTGKHPGIVVHKGHGAYACGGITHPHPGAPLPGGVVPCGRELSLELFTLADVCLELGAQYGIPVLDLHAHSKKYVLEKGLQDAKPVFFPGDYTHTNDFGAYKMAGYVAQEIREKCKGHSERAYAYLAECVTDGFGAWEPVGQINVPKKPEIYKDIPDPAGDQVLLSEAEQLERVVRLCLKEELL